MTIIEKIKRSEAFIQWLDKKINGLAINSDSRTRISATCFQISREHHKAIVLLISHKLIGSAFSLLRLLFEAYIRGVWLGRCATEDELEKYKNDKLSKKFETLIKEIEQIDGFEQGVLSEAKRINWSAFNSFTHSGFFQIVRSNTPETIEPNYDEEEILGALGYADAVALLSALQIAFFAGNEEFIKELAEKEI